MPSNLQALRAQPLLAGLRVSDLKQISRVLQAQQFKSKTVLFVEGAPYSGLHLIAAGRVKLVTTTQGKEQILTILGPGEVLDPIPLFDGGAHCATAKTMTATALYRLDPAEAMHLLDAYPVIHAELLRIVSTRLRKLAALASDLAFKDVAARVAHALLEQAADGERTPRGIYLSRALTRQELASLVGTAREVAWRAVKKLERHGAIRIEEHRIVIVDEEKLARMM